MRYLEAYESKIPTLALATNSFAIYWSDRHVSLFSSPRPGASLGKSWNHGNAERTRTEDVISTDRVRLSVIQEMAGDVTGLHCEARAKYS